MCNLYNLRTGREQLARAFDAVDPAAALEKDYVSPGRPGLVMVNTAEHRQLLGIRWGFPPPANVKTPVVNVRNYASPFWRSALANSERRCLVPVTSFQEWSAEADPTTGRKRPHWFSVPSRPVFAFAGVWRPTTEGAVFAFLTAGYDGEMMLRLRSIVALEDQVDDMTVRVAATVDEFAPDHEGGRRVDADYGADVQRADRLLGHGRRRGLLAEPRDCRDGRKGHGGYDVVEPLKWRSHGAEH